MMAEPGTLSERETEVLRLVAKGLTNEQIARQLVISTNTVKVHLRNIFAKLGVASRTEASLYAVRHGWVVLEAPPTTTPVEAAPTETALPAPAPRPGHLSARVLLVASVVVLAVALAISLPGSPLRIGGTPASPSPFTAQSTSRWTVRAPLPVPRSDLTLVPFGGALYAIGGEGANGLSDANERFDPATNTWTSLAAKPTAVIDVQAAVLHGHIYVPGGRGSQGSPIQATEVYLVESNQWTTAAPLPRPLSAYALASFEGKLYLFGGWDGKQYRDEILSYELDADRWEEIGRLPFPWGHAAAVVVRDHILLVGGVNADGPLTMVLNYSPAQAIAQPQPLSGVILGHAQATVLSDLWVYVVAESETSPGPQIWQHNVLTTTWQLIEPSPSGVRPGVALAGVGTQLFLVGGINGTTPVSQVQQWQAMYTVGPALPGVKP